MSTRTHFLYRIDMWTVDGEKVIEHLAGVEDFKVAMATYKAACDRWPGTAITLRQGARVIEAPVCPNVHKKSASVRTRGKRRYARDKRHWSSPYPQRLTGGPGFLRTRNNEQRASVRSLSLPQASLLLRHVTGRRRRVLSFPLTVRHLFHPHLSRQYVK